MVDILKKPNFRRKIENYETVSKCRKSEKGDLLGFFNIQRVAKYKTNEGGPSEGILKISKKNESQCQKKIQRGPFILVRFCIIRLKSQEDGNV